MLSFPCLLILAQHFSSSLTERTLEFLSPLILIHLFPTTLLPASILGLGITLASVVGSGRVGKWVDEGRPRLRVARVGVLVQKIGQVGVYLGLLGLFWTRREEDGSAVVSSNGDHSQDMSIRSITHHFRSDTDTSSQTSEISSAGTGIALPQALLLAWIVIFCMIGRLATQGITLAVEREWVLIICTTANDNLDLLSSADPSIPPTPSLTTLTTSLRRIYLLTRLLSPFLVTSLISLSLSFSSSSSMKSPSFAFPSRSSLSMDIESNTTNDNHAYEMVILGMMIGSIVMGVGEWLGVGMIWRGWRVLEEFERKEKLTRFGTLETEDDGREELERGEGVIEGEGRSYRMIPLDATEDEEIDGGAATGSHESRTTSSFVGTTTGESAVNGRRQTWPSIRDIGGAMMETWEDLREFARLPVFLSSLSISSLYLTTLSFDGILLSYLISTQHLSPTTIALTSGLCVLTGLLGTILMPLGEKHIGLIRTGAWAVWSEAFCLVLVLIALGLSFNTFTPFTFTIFFTSIAFSRVGLYAFDLVQTNEIQLVLKDHPKRGRFQALQMGMQSFVEVGKYGVVMVLNRPGQFPYTALISTIAVFIGGLLYTRYVYKVRGHVLHWSKLWGEGRHA